MSNHIEKPTWLAISKKNYILQPECVDVSVLPFLIYMIYFSLSTNNILS